MSRSTPDGRRRGGLGPWGGRLARMGGILLGAVLLVAAVAKAAEPAAFAEEIHREGLDFLFSAQHTALLALALETLLGAALLLGLRHRLVLLPTTLLVLFFLFLTGRHYWLVSQGLRDATTSCGCFGSLIERSPGEAFWQDLFLLLPLTLLAWWRRSGRESLSPSRLLAAAFGAAAVVWVASSNPDLRFQAAAQQIASLEIPEKFVEVAQYAVSVDGREDREARVYLSEATPEILLVSEQLPSALLLDPRQGRFLSLPREAVTVGEQGVEVLRSRSTDPGESFQVSAQGIDLVLGERRIRITNRP